MASATLWLRIWPELCSPETILFLACSGSISLGMGRPRALGIDAHDLSGGDASLADHPLLGLDVMDDHVVPAYVEDVPDEELLVREGSQLCGQGPRRLVDGDPDPYLVELLGPDGLDLLGRRLAHSPLPLLDGG